MPASVPRDSTLAVVGDGFGSLIVYATAIYLGYRPEDIAIFGTNDNSVGTYQQFAHNLGQTVLRSESESHFLPADWPTFAQLDAFVNVFGGMQLREPSGDLAVAAALASSVFDRALPVDAIFVGELGLGGEVRPVSQIDRRIAEASNLGLKRVYLSERGVPKRANRDVELITVRTIQDLLKRTFS